MSHVPGCLCDGTENGSWGWFRVVQEQVIIWAAAVAKTAVAATIALSTFAAATTAGCVGMSTVIIVATNIAELLITYHRWAVW